MKRTLTTISVIATLCSCGNNLPQVLPGTAPIEYQNVVVHDPSIMKTPDGMYYVNGSDMAGARSADLINWEQISKDVRINDQTWFTDIHTELAHAFSWGHTNTFWAGCMIQLKSGPYAGKYMINYCVCQGGCPQAGIGYALSDVPQGPYKDMGMILYSFGSGRTDDIYDKETIAALRAGERGDVEARAECTAPDGTKYSYNSNLHPNAIDPCTFYDTDGQLWMLYGSFSGGIYILKLNDDGTIHREPGEDYYGKLLMGNYHSCIEGPFMMYSPETGYYYMFASFGLLQATGGYNVRVFRSRTPDGDFVDAAGNHAIDCKGQPGKTLARQHSYISKYGLKMMGNFEFLPEGAEEKPSEGYMSPGHNSALYDSERDQYFFFFHTRFKGSGDMFQVRVHEMFMNKEGWPVLAPHRYSGDIDVKLRERDVTGDYKFVNHGTAITADITESAIISINGDGTISGAATGKWHAEKGGKHLMADFTIDGKDYSGLFFYQYDPANNVNRVTFTACGSSNETIWGSKCLR